LVSRVDVDDQPTGSTLINFAALARSENAVCRTLTEKGNVELAKFSPIMRSNISNLSTPVLPNNLQWYPCRDVSLHIWKGCIIGAALSELNISPLECFMDITSDIEIEFRGRIASPTNLFGGVGAYNYNRDGSRVEITEPNELSNASAPSSSSVIPPPTYPDPRKHVPGMRR
jgi:hypothetical protein